MSEYERATLLNEEDAKKYQGQYVTVSDQHSKKVLCNGENIAKVYKETERLGYKDPVVIYVPVSGEDFVYSTEDPQLLDVYT